jgi:HAD superfamily hydrolase (TIGR01509 family)
MLLPDASSQLRAVIFDLDGLLVDSEPLQFRAYRDAFLDHGIHLTRSDWHTWHELGASAAAWLESGQIEGPDPESIRRAKKLIYDDLIASELVLKPGAGDLVETLAFYGVRLSVASGSRFESIEACLERFGLRNHFEQLFSATTTARKKPYPDIYHLAMDQMSLSPANTVAIEDSPAGLRAAVAAGLKCVVCPDHFVGYDPIEYDGAALLVSSLFDLDIASLDQVLCS